MICIHLSTNRCAQGPCTDPKSKVTAVSRCHSFPYTITPHSTRCHLIQSVVSPHHKYLVQNPFAVTSFQKSMCRDKGQPGMRLNLAVWTYMSVSRAKKEGKQRSAPTLDDGSLGTLTTAMVIPHHADDATSSFEWGTVPTGKADVGKRRFRRAFVCACMWSRGPLHCSELTC